MNNREQKAIEILRAQDWELSEVNEREDAFSLAITAIYANRKAIEECKKGVDKLLLMEVTHACEGNYIDVSASLRIFSKIIKILEGE